MADIELVIKIDEETANEIKDNAMFGVIPSEILWDVTSAIVNSTPLPKGHEPRWIPVSEKLPNFNDIVLASTDSDYEELRVILTVYEADEFWFNGKIKAWMPTPEPYKAESEDKNG